MPYIVDGHNLIPRIPNISLSDLDDEIKLIQILQQYANQRRSRIEVYFDKAPAAKARVEEHGSVQAHFIQKESTADLAIKTRIRDLGKKAKNWTVVSSDRDIQAEARSYRCRIMRSSDFARELFPAPPPEPIQEEKESDPEIPPQDVNYWLDQFSD
jgi:predicted RNA-binding protein with PIN domain